MLYDKLMPIVFFIFIALSLIAQSVAEELKMVKVEKKNALPMLQQRPNYKLAVPVPKLPFQPKIYPCFQTKQAVKIDGVLDDAAWQAAPWSDFYVDIEGSLKPAPSQQTRSKMCWDRQYLYIAAELKETDLWATLTKRDSIIFYDNDFEVFLDPDGDNHHYYELEINALNTVWDLLLLKPYRDGGPALHDWDIKGLKTAVTLQGTLNDSSDVDLGWRVEIAIPFAALRSTKKINSSPKIGDRWKVNFSRVQWELDKKPDHKHSYTKRLNPATGKSLPEKNWVWSPQGLVNMHYPERWGLVEFLDERQRVTPQKLAAVSLIKEDERVAEALMQAFYHLRNAQEQLQKKEKTAIANDSLIFPRLTLPKIKLPAGWSALTLQQNGFAFFIESAKGKTRLSVDHEGRLKRINIDQ